ncbi:MAG: hypothetical protein JXR76_10950 [Deltaproteobacteria bacterium]|nr:hypothetical protein [Deltaproteobacteria bacterium]
MLLCAVSLLTSVVTHGAVLNGDANIVVTTIPEANSAPLMEDSITVICEELEVTGFNVVRTTYSAKENASLKHYVNDALDKNYASLAVVITQSSNTAGTVLLFAKQGLDEVTALDSVNVKFPLPKDKAELVAFKVSETAALLSDGMHHSTSPIPVDYPQKVHSITAQSEKKTKSQSAESAKKVTGKIRFGVYLAPAAELSPGNSGVIGGSRLGARWQTKRQKAFHFEVNWYPFARPIHHDDVTVTLDFLITRLHAAHIFTLTRFLSLNAGLSIGMGYIWTTGNVHSPTDDDGNLLQSKKETGIFFYAGGGITMEFRVNHRIVIPLRVEMGAIPNGAKFSYATPTADGEKKDTIGEFGQPMVEASAGILIEML